jgi:hypothetical protein
MNTNRIAINLALCALFLGVAESSVQQKAERTAAENRAAALQIEAAKMRAEALLAREISLSSPVRLGEMARRHLGDFRPMRPIGDTIRAIEIAPGARAQ